MADSRLTGHVVVITGGGGGLGRALALAFARRGATIAALDRDFEAARATVALLPATASPAHLALACDVCDPDACRETMLHVQRSLGRIDTLVNNAGISHHSLAEATDIDVVRRVLDVNFLGAVHCTTAALPMLRTTRGRIAVMSSVAGFAPLHGRSAYAASKHALHGWFDTLRAELAGTGLSVTMITPSFVRTAIDAHALSGDGSPNRHTKPVTGRLADPDTIAARIVPAILARTPRVAPTLLAEVAWWVSRVAPSVYQRLMLRSQARTID